MIGLDWGTTSLRAYRLDPNGAVLDKRESKSGILAVKPGGFS
jgi:2-dehydro-3-deoxygalactonokinase